MNIQQAIGTKKKFSSPEHATRLAWAGVWIVFGALLPIGVWMAVAPLSMAVMAPAFVKVDLNRRPVQHLEGGIVHTVLVRDGQSVNAGDPILILGDVSVDADRNRLTYRVHVERAAIARLEAQVALAAKLKFPVDLVAIAKQDERVELALAKETALFEAGLNSLTSEVALMKMQRDRVDEEIIALRAQIRHAKSSHDLQEKSLEANRQLLDSGFIAPSRLQQLEAGLADYAIKLEERKSELSRTQQRLGDIDLKIKSLENEYVRKASDQLKVTSAQLAEIEQELRKSKDAAVRQTVSAPASGEVMDLKFTSPGAVVRAGEPIADIVPRDARLMIEAQVRPEDVNNVYRDQRARINFTAFKFRNNKMVTGKVTYVSADRLVDRNTNLPYYSVTILADPDSLHSISDLKLVAGMPAEVYIEGADRTPLQYLMAPLTDVVRKAGHQM
jgi:membrane fusion protein, epimerase transport system